MKILSIGEILWDVFDDGERLGGAPFNFAVHARRLGHEVRFLSAVGRDDRGARALAAMERYGLPTGFVATVSDAPTGAVKVALAAGGHPSFTIERPAAYDYAALDSQGEAALTLWQPDWVSFGTLQQLYPHGRALTSRAIELASGARRFYDVNLRKDSYTPELVAALMRQTDVLKLNEDEVGVLAGICGAPAAPIERFCRFCAREFSYRAIAVTLGEKGSAVMIGEDYAEAPGYRVDVCDTVGAGDAFSAAFLDGLGKGRTAGEVADFANRVGALVASRAGAIPDWSPQEVMGLSRV